MENRKRPGKIRVKSPKRVIISIVLLLLVGVGIFFGLRIFLTEKSKEVSGEQVGKATPALVVSTANIPDSTPTAKATKKVSSVEEAMKELRETMISNREVSVKVVNYTRIEGLAEGVRNVLESYGFIVAAGNDSTLKRVNSAIVEKKENVPGSGIMNVLDIKSRKMELDNDSRFDILVIIGDDFSLESKQLETRINKD